MKKIFLMLSLVIAFGFQSFGQKNNAKEDTRIGDNGKYIFADRLKMYIGKATRPPNSVKMKK